MNKSVAVMNLPIPRDVANYLCSFVYYTVEESIQRHRTNYTDIISDLFYTIRLQEVYEKYSAVMIYNITSNFDIIIYVCKCGDYRYKSHKRNCKCRN